MTNQGVMELGHSMTAESISILPRRIAAITLEEKAPYQLSTVKDDSSR